MSKFENLGFPIKDGQGREIPGAVYITSETMDLEYARRRSNRRLIAGLALGATMIASSYLPQDFREAMSNASDKISTTVYDGAGHVPVIGESLQATMRLPEEVVQWTGATVIEKVFPEDTRIIYHNDIMDVARQGE